MCAPFVGIYLSATPEVLEGYRQFLIGGKTSEHNQVDHGDDQCRTYRLKDTSLTN